MIRLALLSLTLAGASCQSSEWSRVGRRAREDALVVVTVPLNVPLMAVHDAWNSFDHGALRVAAFPVTFVVHGLKHTLLSALHLLDLTAAPLHYWSGLAEPGVYAREGILLGANPAGEAWHAAGDMALWSGALWGGLLMTYWFYGVFLPGLFSGG